MKRVLRWLGLMPGFPSAEMALLLFVFAEGGCERAHETATTPEIQEVRGDLRDHGGNSLSVSGHLLERICPIIGLKVKENAPAHSPYGVISGGRRYLGKAN